VRDESGAALDAESRGVYLAMLRRAAERIGADKVLFVTHDEESQQLADARITVQGGEVVVS
jgi:ABC-type lipoprotein export system ATPase subunit